MEQNKFFKWTQRINSVLFLILIILSIGFLIFMIFETSKWGNRNTVEVIDNKFDENIENLHLSDISKVCGQNIQYIKLKTPRKSKRYSSGGYRSNTRNVIFFIGNDMESHWLFNTNKNFISKMQQLKTKSDNCKTEKTVAIFYQIIKEDSNSNGKLDENDALTISLTSPNGKNYVEIESKITSVLDYSVNKTASILTLLLKQNNKIIMKKYSLSTNKKISEREVTRIGKKL